MLRAILLLIIFAGSAAAQVVTPNCGTTATTNSSGVVTSGDSSAHAPPNYTTFVPPVIGGTWTDQQFGCTITRATAAATDGFPGGSPLTEHHFYINNPLSKNNDRLIVIDNNGSAYVLDLAGHRIITSAAITNQCCNGGTSIYWSRISPYLLYWKVTSGGNEILRKADTTACTSASPCSSLSTTDVFTQTCAAGLNTNNEDDMRTDGLGHDFVGWDCGTTFGIVNATAGTESTTFTNTNSFNNYKIGHDSAGTMYICLSMNSGTSGSGSAGVASQGTWCYNSSSTQIGQATTSAQHANFVYDPAVSKLFWVQEQSGNEIPSLNPCQGAVTSGTEEIQISSSIGSHVCLWNWPTFFVNTHVSGGDHGLACSEVYTNAGQSPLLFNQFSSMDANWATDWIAFYGEIICFNTSNNTVYRLADHRSRVNDNGTQDYWAEPRNALSMDATRVVFDSNQVDACCSSPAYVTSYSDVYVVQIASGTAGPPTAPATAIFAKR
jgi:hypothetical protein